MSLIKSGKSQDPIRLLSESLKAQILQSGASFASRDTTEGVLSFESLSDPRQQSIENSFNDIRSVLRATLQEVGLEALDEDGPWMAAGALAALAAGNPVEYARRAYTGTAQSAEGVTVIDSSLLGLGSNGSTDYTDRVSLEAFDDRELREHLPTSIVFNVYGSRQDPAAEALYPTITVSPELAGVDVTVERMLVFSELRRATGKAADFKKRNLTDAYADFTVLSDEAIRIIPARLADDSNASLFIDPDLVATYFVTLSGVDVPTAPYAMGKTIDLIGTSGYAPLIGAQVLDNGDALDARITLDAIYLQVAANVPAVKFNTSKTPKNGFTKTIEGNGKAMQLQFSTADLIIDKNTKNVVGAAPVGATSVFADIAAADYTVRLAVDISGSSNVETANTKVWSAPITVASITDANSVNISLTSGGGLAIKNALEAMAFVGYDLNARRTNSNLRTRGLMLDTTTETERYTIPLGSPITVPAPTSSTRDAADLKALITASRIRNTNNAITAALNYCEALAAHVKGPKRKDIVPEVAGMGRWLVEPFFEAHTADILKSLNSTKTQEKPDDVSAVLTNYIKDVSARMYKDSKYQAALDASTGGTGEKPRLVIVTDQYIVGHLMKAGDTRTFGDYFQDFVIEATQDRRMTGKILITFVRANASKGPDPLSFGSHAWMPELASTIQAINRNGATIKESMVQPRTLHVNHLPVAALLTVTNLVEALTDKIAMATEANDVGNPYLAGLTQPTP